MFVPYVPINPHGFDSGGSIPIPLLCCDISLKEYDNMKIDTHLIHDLSELDEIINYSNKKLVDFKLLPEFYNENEVKTWRVILIISD